MIFTNLVLNPTTITTTVYHEHELYLMLCGFPSDYKPTI